MLGTYTVLVLVLLVLNPCAGSTHDSDSKYEHREFCCAVNDECFPSHHSIAMLDKNIDGYIILPNMYEYINQSHMYNTVEQRSPSIIVMVMNADDIREAVLFARNYNLRVTIRSSGHDYSGRSTWDGSLNINLSKMKEHSVILNSARHESGELKVQTGLQWIEIYTLLEPYKRTIVGGSGKTVTPGGYTLGGGHSPISKTFGYAVDNVLEIQVVLPDGRIATCTETETVIEDIDDSSETVQNGDLFWALRGGGGGTFGVVVYFVFKIHPAPNGMVVLNTFIPLKIKNYQLDLTSEVFEIINTFPNLPSEWGGFYLLNNMNLTIPKEDTGLDVDLYTTGSLTLHINKFAPWDGTEMATFKAFIDFCNQNEIQYTFKNVSNFLEYAELAYDPPFVRTYLASTLLQPEKQNQEFTDFFKQEMFGTLKDIYFSCTGIMLGGRTKDVSVDSTPLHPGYRTASGALTCGIALGDGSAYPSFKQSTWDEILLPINDAFSQRLQQFGSGMYFNEPTKSNPNWKNDFWGEAHYERLLEIKRVYDPEGFFTCHHCVGSELRSTINDAPPVVGGSLPMMFAMLSLFCAIYIL